MKKIVFTLVCLAFVASLNATHLAGAIIRYKVINDTSRTYQIFLEITRECTGVPLGANDNVNVYCGANCANNILNVPVVRDSIRVKSQVCDLSQTTCNGGTLPGLETHYYSAIVQLPICVSKYYTFAWSSGNRNGAVLNLDNAIAQLFSVYSTHKFNYVSTTTNYTKNTAPTLLAPPAPFFYTGSQVCYSINAIDTVDKDSLAYELVPCAGNNAVGQCADILTYAGTPPQYSFSQPFGTSIVHTFDPLTGTLTFTPPASAVGLYNFSVKIKEYRKGNLIGEYIRDLQCAIISGGTNISCNPSTAGAGGAVVTPNSNQIQGLCDSSFTINIAYPAGGSPNFVIDTANSNIPSWAAVNITNSTAGVAIQIIGFVPCSLSYIPPLVLKLKQQCGPGITIPALANFSVVFRKVGSLLNINTATTTSVFSMYPNPMHDVFSIATQEKINYVTMKDASGKIIMSLNAGTNFQNIATKFMSPGIYYVTVLTDKNTYHSKLIKE